jgi:hypothetical protein
MTLVEIGICTAASVCLILSSILCKEYCWTICNRYKIQNTEQSVPNYESCIDKPPIYEKSSAPINNR